MVIIAENNTIHKNLNKDLTVEGYSFLSKEEAQIAKDELHAIKYVSSKVDSKDARQVYVLYNSILDKEMFHTPIGLEYLKKLQDFLYKSKEIPDNKIRAIPVDFNLQSSIDNRHEVFKSKGEVHSLKRKSQQYKDYVAKLVIVNIALIIIIIAMIVILKTNSNPTVLDYENKLQNKYAAWQEQLESQEQSLKTREQQLQKK